MAKNPRRRRRLTAGAAATLVVAGAVLVAAHAKEGARPSAAPVGAQQVIERELDLLDVSLDSLGQAINTGGSPALTSACLRTARTRYKRIEGVAEFYSPALAAALNSRRQEVDDEDAPPPSTLGARGFPAIEAMLASGARQDSHPHEMDAVAGMRAAVRSLHNASTQLVITGAQLVEIGRSELARVSTLGIAGFDAPKSGRAMIESAEALDGVRELYAAAAPVIWAGQPREWYAVDSTLRMASAALRANPDFVAFDRLRFLADFAEPAARSIERLRRAAATRPVGMRRAWRLDAPSVYDEGAFDPRDYAPAVAPRPTPELVALGKRLFADPRLSGTGTRACVSCHVPTHAFTDGLAKETKIDGRGALVARHTPTLINAAIQPAQFCDERVATLEDQVGEVLRSPAEMASSPERAAAVLGRVPEYRADFAGAFGVSWDSAVTPTRVRLAVAAYVRSLVALDAPFDRAVRGEPGALSPEERRGFTLFMGKAACGTCHFAPLFSGNTPPRYLGSDVEVIGTPLSPATPKRPDPDSGRGRIDQLPIHLRAFKTPSLRNVALTAPYMHNGSFQTLEQVVDFYDGGGGAGAGAPIANQTLAADSLHLTADEKHALIAFLRTLTDTVTARPPGG
ncbi:MAG TPA: cytochrome c peroxidase [Gemmatimonadaceae bacterium]|nr:cytochrome c peroxidase [Gemmatimonadaceae bacterium]